MSRADLQATIDNAWEDRDNIGLDTTGPVREAVAEALNLMDSGAARVAVDHGVPAGAAVMLDDMSVNLAPAAAMGMTTVWMRTHYSWSGDEAEDPDHAHHITDDVTAWLEGVVAAG